MEVKCVDVDTCGTCTDIPVLCDTGDSEDDVTVVSGSQQQPSSRLRKRKVNEQNKGSRKRTRREVKLNLSPEEIACLQFGEMLNDTHRCCESKAVS